MDSETVKTEWFQLLRKLDDEQFPTDKQPVSLDSEQSTLIRQLESRLDALRNEIFDMGEI